MIDMGSGDGGTLPTGQEWDYKVAFHCGMPGVPKPGAPPARFGGESSW